MRPLLLRRSTVRILGRRLVALFITLLLGSFLIFAALYVAPGNPLATLTKGRTLNPEALAQIKAQYHLDDPFIQRYFLWLGDALHGDFGRSIVTRDEVSSLISARVGTTVFLLIYAGILTVAGGIALGLVAGVRGGATGAAARLASSVGLATPSFVAAIFLVTLFAVNLGWFPVFGPGDGFVDRLYHLTLPAIALSLSLAAYIARITQAAVLDELGREHVETARSRAIPQRIINRRHVLRNALIPIATASSLTFASLLSAMVVVDQAFGLDGLGSLLVKAVQQGDFAVAQAIALIFIVVFVMTNILMDILYQFLDPRMSHAGGAGR